MAILGLANFVLTGNITLINKKTCNPEIAGL
jgi:hypothetical protein